MIEKIKELHWYACYKYRYMLQNGLLLMEKQSFYKLSDELGYWDDKGKEILPKIQFTLQ